MNLKSLLSEVSSEWPSSGSLYIMWALHATKLTVLHITVMASEDSIRSVLLPWLEVNDAWPTTDGIDRLLVISCKGGDVTAGQLHCVELAFPTSLFKLGRHHE